MCRLEFKMITCLVVVILGIQDIIYNSTPQIIITPMQMDGIRISVPEIVFPYYVVRTFAKLVGEVNYMMLICSVFIPQLIGFSFPQYINCFISATVSLTSICLSQLSSFSSLYSHPYVITVSFLSFFSFC